MPVDIHAILYVPTKRERGIFSLRKDDGLKLYSRKILISEYFKDLLPQYFRFIQGVVDSEDLPLNVSREAIQSNRAAAKLKSTLTHKVATELADLGEKDAAKYATFWQEFGQFVKEGIATDPANQTDLAKLLRFKTNRSDEWTSLQQVVDRMKPDQTSIYYILGEDLTSVARSPHLDYFRQHELEVLYFVEPIDSFMVMTLKEFAGKKLQNVDDAALELPKDDKPIESKVESEDFAQLAARIKTTLGEADHRSARIEAVDRQPVPPRLAGRRNRSRYAARAAHAGPGLRSAQEDHGDQSRPHVDCRHGRAGEDRHERCAAGRLHSSTLRIVVAAGRAAAQPGGDGAAHSTADGSGGKSQMSNE